MGILRTDKLSGLETPTAVTGSVSFDGTNDILSIGSVGNWNFLHNGLTDWTVEFWGKSGTAVRQFVWGTGGSSALRGFHFHIMSSSNGGADAQGIYAQVSSGSAGNYRYWGADNCLLLDTWHHIAAVFKSSDKTLAIYVDGREVDNDTGTENGTFSYSSNDSSHPLLMGENPHANVDDLNGEISNLRVVAGRRLYTSEFTPPVHALEPIDGTVVLCCNNPDSVTASSNAGIGTAHIITTSGDPTLGTDYPGLTRDFTFGTQFEGVAKFDTQGYFVPPSGTTEQRGAGRGILYGGYRYNPNANQTIIESIQISSSGNAQKFGDIDVVRYGSVGVASPTRGVFFGGADPSTSDIDFITIATEGNPVEFGNATTNFRNSSGVSNGVRGIVAGKFTPSTVGTIDYITIAALGDAQDFGDLSETRHSPAAASSNTRGVFAGGAPTTNTIDYVTIATVGGTAQDFGDLTVPRGALSCSSISNGVRGVFGGGTEPALSTTIDFVTIATLGNAQDFGDLSVARGTVSGLSDKVRGIFAGGYTPGPTTSVNTIEYVTISSTGNTQDFGDMSIRRALVASCSDSHGGLS